MALVNASEVITEIINTVYSDLYIEVINVPLAITPVQGGAVTVGEGTQIAIRASRDNGRKEIYVAKSSADALDPTKRIVLKGGESISMTLDNLNLLWFGAEVDDLNVEVFFEV